MATSGSGSDEIANIKCNACAEDRTRDAEKYCVECNNYYCSSCLDMHTIFPTLKGHQLLDKGNFGSRGSDTSLPTFPTERCSLHPSKIVDMFCKDHDEVACAACIALSHRACSNISYIPEEVNSLYIREQLINARQKINTTKDSIEEIMRYKEAGMKEMKKSLDEAVESVKSFAEEIKNLVDMLAHSTVQELKAEFDQVESRFKADLKEAEDIIYAVDERASKLRKSEGNAADGFVCIKSSQKVTKKAEEYQRKARTKNTEETIYFVADRSILTFLQQISSLGKVSSVKTISPKTSRYMVKKQRVVDIKLDDDAMQFYIYGSCITEGGFLLLTDFYNKKLKRVDLSTEMLKDHVAFQEAPRAVCQVSKAEAAVTLCNNTVQFVTLADSLTAARILTFGHYCFGLAHISDRLVISDSGANVYIYNKAGQQLQSISPTNILQCTLHVAVSDDEDRMFIADYINGLVILDIKGNHLSTLSDPSVSLDYGVCTDGSSVFVCGYSSHNIVQFGKDYKLMGEIIKVTNPLSLSFDRKKSRLIITNNSEKITLLELE